MTTIHHGGTIIGRGKHGQTLDAGRTSYSKEDTDTLYHQLSYHVGKPWTLYIVDHKMSTRNGALRLVECTSPADQAHVISAVDHATDFIAKTFLGASNRSPKKAFEMEIGSKGVRTRVIEAYGGIHNCSEFTTIASGISLGNKTELVGICVKHQQHASSSSYFMVSSKCQTSLDRYVYRSSNEFLEMARDLLDSFSKLHANGVLHADVKLDNMVFCSKPASLAPGRRFKLIDWGGSMDMKQLINQYKRSGEPRNTLSPMAWYAWGLGTDLTTMSFMPIHARMYPHTFVTSGEFFRFCLSSLNSFSEALDQILVEAEGCDKRARTIILERHAKSFDLYNMGMAFASLAFSSPSATVRKAKPTLLRLAHALTHYNDPGFCGNDAAMARKLV